MFDVAEVLKHPIQVVKVELISMNVRKLNSNLKEEDAKKIKIEFKNWSEIVDDRQAYSFLQLDIKPRNEDKGLFIIEVVLRGTCEATKPVLKDQLDNFAEVQSIALLWPYMRQQISTITSSLDVPAIMLPTLDIAKAMGSAKEDVDKK